MAVERNMALTGQPPKSLNTIQKIGVLVGMSGLLILVLAIFNINLPNKTAWLAISLIALIAGIITFSKGAYDKKLEGIKNDAVWFNSISSRGVLAWIAGVALTGFYIVLYFYAELLGLGQGADGTNTGLVGLFDPLSRLLSGNPASQWFVYGTLYTVAIISFGVKFIMKYKHNRYEQLRTVSVMFFQTAFAFVIPELMARLNSDTFSLPYNDLKNMWPLNYYAFEQWRVDQFINAQTIGLFFLILAVLMVFVISPWLTYKYGKRWYCSWVCGCGGLAETAGDSFRQLSDKGIKAWKFERWMINSVLVFSVVMTVATISTYLGYDSTKYWFTKNTFLISVGAFLTIVFATVTYFKRDQLNNTAFKGAIGAFAITIGFLLLIAFVDLNQLKINASYFSFGLNTKKYAFDGALRSFYAFGIGSIFSGVIGTGFYPILGNRIWCRMGCPMAGIMGIQQRLFSKFRITTNGGQCISCGNCSTYCEQGIDVRAYAQKGENIVRSSCVGCGICSAVCPRGVLKLENDSLDGRINSNEILLGNDVDLMDYVNKK
ncbi:4Fe-4S binding protein [Aquimarina sp. AD10]|uniref:4Fe-4S binding protein n=1 Tax=Aquimarina sp. AD10 TaxID=1714849 RepID=UPI000E50F3DE|nr:4Fe-4S dicluster domain-containing protein [Aquimarina sp. AD10]AXT62518.1 4Fe-4S binding protein [Aquimarina sp. AD10]RKM90290.1 4Fe-4S binding protein [Aquimarina sp. AD10]